MTGLGVRIPQVDRVRIAARFVIDDRFDVARVIWLTSTPWT